MILFFGGQRAIERVDSNQQPRLCGDILKRLGQSGFPALDPPFKTINVPGFKLIMRGRSSI